MPEPALLPATSLALDISLSSIAIILLRYRWLYFSTTILCFIVFGGISYKPETWYTSTISFSPKGRPAASAASGFLARFGLGSLASSGGDAYLVDLVKSREVLASAAESTFTFQSDTGMISAPLTEIYGIRNRPREITRYLAYGTLASKVKSAPQGPYLIKVSVETPYAELSPLVVTQIVNELNRVNIASRQKNAAVEREFIELRLLEAGVRLNQAEAEVMAFESSNRAYSTSSPVSFERDRMRRQLSMRQELYTSLAKTLDKARIAEVQETPVLTIVERAQVPLKKDFPKWPAKAVLGAFFGLFLGIVLAFFHAYFAGDMEPLTYGGRDYKRLRGALVDDFRNLFSPVGRMLNAIRR